MNMDSDSDDTMACTVAISIGDVAGKEGKWFEGNVGCYTLHWSADALLAVKGRPMPDAEELADDSPMVNMFAMALALDQNTVCVGDLLSPDNEACGIVMVEEMPVSRDRLHALIGDLDLRMPVLVASNDELGAAVIRSPSDIFVCILHKQAPVAYGDA